MAEGGEYEFHDNVIDDDVFDERSELRGPLHSELRSELLGDKLNSFYESVGKMPDVVDPNQFELDKENHLFVKTDKGKVQLTHKNNPRKFVQLNTLRPKMGIDGVRRYLSLSDATISSKSIQALESAKEKLPSDVDIEMTELKRLPEIANTIVQETSFSSLNDEHQVDEPPLPLREIYGLNKALQSIRGELTNNIAKLGELDDHIQRERDKLATADDSNLGMDVKERIEKRLADLETERSARLEVISIGKEKLRTQTNRVRETIDKILNEDTTLTQRIRTLFLEQGVTIASVITAIGFIISTIVLSVSKTLGGPPVTPAPAPPTPPSDPNDLKSWAKKQLRHIADLLKILGEKALNALPGVIGAIVSWLFSTASKVVGYMSEHLWTLILLVVGWIATTLPATTLHATKLPYLKK